LRLLPARHARVLDLANNAMKLRAVTPVAGALLQRKMAIREYEMRIFVTDHPIFCAYGHSALTGGEGCRTLHDDTRHHRGAAGNGQDDKRRCARLGRKRLARTSPHQGEVGS